MNDVTRSGRVKDMALAREAPFVLAGTKVHPAALEVEHAGQTKSLEPRVMKVLVALRRADGHPVSRDELIDSCWAGRVVTDAALNRCVAQLRKALAADSGIRLETIPTVGYRLQQAAGSDGAQIVARSSQNPGTEQPAASPDVTSDASAPSAAPSLSRRYVIAIAGLLTEIFTHMSADRRNHVAVEVTRARMILSRVLPSGEVQSVTTGAGWDFDPATAPDGTIAYVSARSGAFEIWTTTPGGQATQLTSISGSYVARPTWSPRSDSIAFVAVHGRGGEIYTVLRGGGQLRQLTHDATDKRDPTYVQSGEQLLYVERKDGKWRLMQIALADPNTEPRAVPGGQGWKTLRAGPDGVILGQRDGEDTICALNTQTLTTTQMPRSADSAGSGVATTIENCSRLPNSGPHVADIDVWTVGSEGIYVRRGRRVHEPSSIWLYPWNQAGRKLADTPLAAGSIGLDASDRPIFSQALEYQIDLGLLGIADGA